MQLYEAKVADVLRCAQRDEEFVNLFQEYITTTLTHFGTRNLILLRSFTSISANLWYYLLTTLSNLQTLGEEYTGVLRIDRTNTIPKKWMQSLWLSLYIGGEPLLISLLNKWGQNVRSSTTLTPIAKTQLLRTITFIKENKHLLQRLHQSLFYVGGKYYYFSNRLTGIQYVLVRKWLQDDSSTHSFKLLGKLSFLYLLYNLINKWKSTKSSDGTNETSDFKEELVSNLDVGCLLCGDSRNKTCCTPCGHLFCWGCIHESLSYQQNCPVCRESVKPSRIVYLQNYR